MIKTIIFDMFETLITHYESPLYFGTQMAFDSGIPEEKFLNAWRPTEQDRTIGKKTFEDVIKGILLENECYSMQLFNDIVEKRKAAKRECFNHLHSEIIPLLEMLKKRGVYIGLISNCFSEEVEVIKESKLYSYFDRAFFSFEQGVQKPDKEIFLRCLNAFDVKPEECLYVGDGGSFELETASELGMTAVQAVWYLKEGTTQPSKRKEDFIQAESPLEILNYCSKIVFEIK